MNILYSASGVLSFLFVFLLITKKQRSLSDWILSGWFLLILLMITTTYVNHNELAVWQGLLELTDSAVFLFGPVAWFYTRSLTEEGFQFQQKDAFHFIPFFLATAYLFSPLMGSELVSQLGRDIVLVIKMLHLLIYEIAILVRLGTYKAHIPDYFSFTEKVNLDWLQLLAYGFLLIWGIAVVSQALYSFGQIDIPQYGGLVTNATLCVFVLVLGYFGIRQTRIFFSFPSQATSLELPPEIPQPSNSSPKVSPAREVALDPRFLLLQQHMSEQKPYLDGELTLHKLALQVQLPPHQLSQLINQHSGTHFFNFVNQYRVKAVQQKIQEGSHVQQTLLGIAMDCGFNSKASFNRVFKNMTGKTPRQYVEEQ